MHALVRAPEAAEFLVKDFVKAPLIDALVFTNSKGAKPFPWSPELLEKFEACKKSLADATLIQHPVSDAPLGLFADASSRREKLAPAQLNQLSFISQFTTDIKHIKGEDNTVAEAISRINAISLEQEYEDLAKSQKPDEELLRLLENNSSSLQLTKVVIPGTDLSLICDLSTSKPQPYVTPEFRRAIFNKLHNLSHPESRATTRLVADRYVWPSINKDYRSWSRVCQACQRSKVTRHNSAPLGNFDTPSGRFILIHMDVIGPLQVCNDYRYCLTAIDRVTRWPEVWPMRTTTAEEVAETFTREWIARYGVPSVLTTDRGAQFESDLFRRLLQNFATKRIRTTAYHPAANGMIERVSCMNEIGF
ncbi:uncharacterized protein LOC113225643 [Hyposmocoma kahamanoa]|uniref:uncharacterized protein LOC113225643 n=1 Tax=Hyposmocoma kahamanoa TaxID=1477025 RepID=UPI000E6D71C2|nr:uncharacterized protein LOC113225643 [Hyposmocoma kahamanoa]